MRLLITEVAACRECPNYRRSELGDDLGESTQWCGALPNHDIPTGITPPAWCPLPEAAGKAMKSKLSKSTR